MATAPKKAPLASVSAAPAPEAFAPEATAVTVPAEAVELLAIPAASVTEAHGKVRSLIEKGLAETRAAYSKVKTAADETSAAFETSYTHAKTGVVALNLKALEAFRASADANFDFVKAMLGVKSASEYVTLHSEFARKQIETLTGQTKELGELARKVATDSAEPIKAQVAKTFKIAV